MLIVGSFTLGLLGQGVLAGAFIGATAVGIVARFIDSGRDGSGGEGR